MKWGRGSAVKGCEVRVMLQVGKVWLGSNARGRKVVQVGGRGMASFHGRGRKAVQVGERNVHAVRKGKEHAFSCKWGT